MVVANRCTERSVTRDETFNQFDPGGNHVASLDQDLSRMRTERS